MMGTKNLIDEPFPDIPNCELYLCGGPVRDKLLDLPIKDRDFVVLTEMSFDELCSEIEKIGTIFVKEPDFFTIRCRINKEAIDIAFPRGESGYRDGRHPDHVIKVGTLKEDGSRRDFTINSMFMSSSGEILDYFEGQQDLKQGIIRTVGDPKERFSEDYLRIIRAVRFSAKLNFHIEGYVKQAMIKEAKNLSKISSERVKDELNIALKYNPGLTISYVEELNLWGILHKMGLNFQLTNAHI